MAIHPFLAMTAEEMRNCPQIPEKIAWMSCHFSSCGRGLTNLPSSLPPDSLLILDDSTPICGHDPEWVIEQLAECISKLECCGLLLDFQQKPNSESDKFVSILTASLPCPVVVSDRYAKNAACPVFLSPVPPSVALQSHIAPWKGRDIWLELALDGELITLTEHGAEAAPLSTIHPDKPGFCEDDLHCHYKIDLEENAAHFTLWRTREDLDALITEAEALGVSCCIGLYQELHSFG